MLAKTPRLHILALALALCTQLPQSNVDTQYIQRQYLYQPRLRAERKGKNGRNGTMETGLNQELALYRNRVDMYSTYRPNGTWARIHVQVGRPIILARGYRS
jgi:hypothetical protein